MATPGLRRLSQELGRRVTERREALGLLQRDVGAAVGMKRVSVTHLEGGRYQSLRFDKLQALARILETSTDYLLQITDDPAPPVPSRRSAGGES
jgi:transcriptional regulator with XRE-family HTH domain